MKHYPLPVIAIRGAGDLATGVALRLYRAGFNQLVLLETDNPLAVRRTVCFSDAVYHHSTTVENVTAVRIETPAEVVTTWDAGKIPVLCDPAADCLTCLEPDILVDAIIAKQNIGTNMSMAPLVIGLGPGFTVSKNVHRIIETKRGHTLGRVLETGSAIPNTGIPGAVQGYTTERVYWAVQDGTFTTEYAISDSIKAGDELGRIGGTPILAKISGVIRGLLRNGTIVRKGTKVGDIDPRGDAQHCYTVSDKALAIGGGVLEAVTAFLISQTNAPRLSEVQNG
ncbi:selenium-dependent molybdenum cofactor biosynthesis protein YqeB [Halodesulfovibrio marinisediminis]|uniref:Xanthine dehydrogenase accessory factor n=1 Tax=Halodesulfovibrio marinisediminis DSM 17456 TaxID=1121457 RepID=A0A1N6IAI5_9BACT|nr:selenium-dependent molybdenum cofactor biosynthesis protein YqeB [Halodesulfovibrio marinisediminis]SIO28995.1 xanthine dehydrogenase accessory factor [Halodesulfovibrio marinisediminis DSM 17456]